MKIALSLIVMIVSFLCFPEFVKAEVYAATVQSKIAGSALQVQLDKATLSNHKNIKIHVTAAMMTDERCLQDDGEGGCLRSQVLGQHCEKSGQSANIVSGAKLTVKDLSTNKSTSLNNVGFYLYGETTQGAMGVPCDKVPAPTEFFLLAATPKFARSQLRLGEFTVTVGSLDLSADPTKLNLVTHINKDQVTVDLTSVKSLNYSLYVTSKDEICQDESCEALSGYLVQ
jgi:hypothetical protein